MRIVFTGGRDYDQKHTVEKVVAALDRDTLITHGDARGADTLVDTAAKMMGYPVDPHPADWDRYGKKAGMIRNKKMRDLVPDLVVAFPGGNGTKGMCRVAYNAGIPVLKVYATRKA